MHFDSVLVLEEIGKSELFKNPRVGGAVMGCCEELLAEQGV
jgi:hypothetical protein